jgi:hypothetical protein
MKLTKEQRTSLFRVWFRGKPSEIDPYFRSNGNGLQTYRTFRRTVRHGPGCIMVQWQGMWLGIEPDGYTHS